MLILKNAYTALKNKLNTALTIPFIDLWNEEIDMYREEHSIPFPAVFIEFLPITWNTIGNSNTQHGYGTVKVYVIQNIITDSATINGADMTTQTATLDRFNLIQHVHDELQKFSTPFFDELDRVASYLDHNHDGIYIDILEYRTIFKDELTSQSNVSYSNSVTLTDIVVQPNTIPPHNSSSNTGGFAIQN